ncbi:MAG: hypothetical protein QXO32_06185 [Candidatus Bathyarchaeia archaeon]
MPEEIIGEREAKESVIKARKTYQQCRNLLSSYMKATRDKERM